MRAEAKPNSLEALGQRLMIKQNDVLETWIARHVYHGIDALRDNIEELLRETATVPRPELGAVWILRALQLAKFTASWRASTCRCTGTSRKLPSDSEPLYPPQPLFCPAETGLPFGVASDGLCASPIAGWNNRPAKGAERRTLAGRRKITADFWCPTGLSGAVEKGF